MSVAADVSVSDEDGDQAIMNGQEWSPHRLLVDDSDDGYDSENQQEHEEHEINEINEKNESPGLQEHLEVDLELRPIFPTCRNFPDVLHRYKSEYPDNESKMHFVR